MMTHAAGFDGYCFPPVVTTAYISSVSQVDKCGSVESVAPCVHAQHQNGPECSARGSTNSTRAMGGWQRRGAHPDGPLHAQREIERRDHVLRAAGAAGVELVDGAQLRGVVLLVDLDDFDVLEQRPQVAIRPRVRCAARSSARAAACRASSLGGEETHDGAAQSVRGRSSFPETFHLVLRRRASARRRTVMPCHDLLSRRAARCQREERSGSLIRSDRDQLGEVRVAHLAAALAARLGREGSPRA